MCAGGDEHAVSTASQVVCCCGINARMSLLLNRLAGDAQFHGEKREKQKRG